MKKFITFTLCLLLCIAPLGLSACSKSVSSNVNTSIETKGNGGMVATRGDYVYFVNGYNGYNVLSDNLDKTFDVGGLYRAKLNDGGELDYNEKGSVVNAEKLNGKLAGFESTALYVFGDYVYFATPITEVTDKGKEQIDKLEFRRVSISGGSSQRIYKSRTAATNVDFEFYYAKGKIYLMINENGTLKRINCFGKFAKSTVDKNISSVLLPRDEYDVFESDSYENIFYTKTNDEGKIEIYNYNLASNKKEYKQETSYTSIELIDYKFDHIYYKASFKDIEQQTEEYTYYYRIDATENAIRNMAEEKIINAEAYTALCVLENETDGCILQTDSKTYYLPYEEFANSQTRPVAPYNISDSKLDIIGIKNGCIYFNSSNEIKRINIYDIDSTGSVESESIIKIDELQTYSYDIDENNIYVYATSGANTYLYSVKVNNVLEDEEFEQKLLGVYEKADEVEDAE